MAQRYGGRYSPQGSGDNDRPRLDAPHPFDEKRRDRVGARANLLWLIPLLFAFRAFTVDPVGLPFLLAASGLAVLAAWLTREGIRAGMAYEARKVARRPAIPRKIFAAVSLGAGVALAGWTLGLGVALAPVYGAIAAGLHLAAFGLDPLRDKGAEGIDQFQSDRVARAVDEAEKHLTAMKDAILRARDRGLEARVDRFAATARALFRQIESDPGDLTAARKYLSVYLMGARDATARFADIYARNRTTAARVEYEALLNDLETTFANRSRALLTNDHQDLDIEIQVLRDRLAYETPKS